MLKGLVVSSFKSSEHILFTISMFQSIQQCSEGIYISLVPIQCFFYVSLLLLLLSCFSRVGLCDPIEGSPPGFPIPGILQARTLEWVAISFSNAWKWKVKAKLLSCVRLAATPGTAAYQAPPSMGFSRQEYWSGVPLPSPLCLLMLMQAPFIIHIYFPGKFLHLLLLCTHFHCRYISHNTQFLKIDFYSF